MPQQTSVENVTLKRQPVAFTFYKVKSGVPPENITWYQSAKPKIRGGPGKLPYFFTPKRTDNGNIYSCTAQNPDLKLPLQQSVKLNITYSPSIAFDSDDKTIQIREGNNLKVKCISDGNPIPFSLTWSRIKTVISTRNNANVTWLVIQNISRQFTDKYTCEAKNIIGRGIGSKYLQVLYPPSVTVTYQNSSRQLLCLSHGEPDKYVFYKWEHKSEFGKHIRYLGNSSNISVLGHVTRFNLYRLTGWYICSVSNGIADQRGYVIQKGKSFVKITGKPAFVTENINIHYARFGKDAVVFVLVYSFPKYNNISITSMGEHHVLKDRQFHVKEKVIKDTLNKVNIKLSGYEISLQKYSLDKNDFTKYRFQVTNKMGSQMYTVELVSANEPEAPLNLTALPQTTSIIVSWTKHFNGGFKQWFWIEYKEDKFLEWTKEGPKNDSKQNTFSHTLYALKPNTKYTIRVFSENEIGKSNNSNTFTVKTSDSNSNAVLIVVCIIVALCLVATAIWIVSKGILKEKCSIIQRLRQETLHDDRDHELAMMNAMAVENDMYQTAGLREIEQQRAFGHSADSGSRESPGYLFDVHNSIYDTGSTARTSEVRGADCRNQNIDSDDASRESRAKKDVELNYAEVLFTPGLPSAHFVIHGQQDKVVYSDVDLSAGLRKPLEYDDRCSDNPDDDDDDFMYVEGIMDFTKTRNNEFKK